MENWKDITGYENHYQISDLGRVKSLKHGKEKLIKHRDSNGYKYIGLSIDGKSKNNYIHRLVALHFIPNPKNKREVNHIDGVKSNNQVKNLEWSTPKENSQHSYDTGLSKKGDNHYLRIRKNGVQFPKKSN